MKQRIIHISSFILFALLGVQGLWSSIVQWEHCDTSGKMVQTAALFGYGAIGVICAALQYSKRLHLTIQSIQVAWTLCIVTAAGMAPVVWGSAPIFTGLFSAIGGATIAITVLLLARFSNPNSRKSSKE